MKPAPIASYLDHFGRTSAERAPPTRATSPFRPRSLQSSQEAEPQRSADFERAAKTIGAVRPQIEEHAPPTPGDRRRPAARASAADSLVAREAAKAEEMAARLADAYARGRDDGRAEASAEAEELRAADRAAAQEQAAAERIAFRLDEYSRLEAALRAGIGEIGEKTGAAVSRILAPFLATQVIKRATDELRENIGRLCAGKAPGMIRIRGPERVLSLLRERIADLPVEVEYVEDRGRRGGRRGRPDPDRHRAASMGGAARFARLLSGADERRSSRDRHRPTAQRARGRASRRGVEDRLCRLHDGNDGLLPRPVDHQRHR